MQDLPDWALELAACGWTYCDDDRIYNPHFSYVIPERPDVELLGVWFDPSAPKRRWVLWDNHDGDRFRDSSPVETYHRKWEDLKAAALTLMEEIDVITSG